MFTKTESNDTVSPAELQSIVHEICSQLGVVAINMWYSKQHMHTSQHVEQVQAHP